MTLTRENADIILDTIEFEGHFVDDPDDRGGPTKFGITQKTLDTWTSTHGFSPAKVNELKENEAVEIYHATYLIQPGLHKIPSPYVRRVVFDAGVVHGPGTAIRWLQESCVSHPDGIIGPRTLENLAANDDLAVTTEITQLRVAYCIQIVENDPTQRKFLHGWINRAIDVLALTWLHIEHGGHAAREDRLRLGDQSIVKPSEIVSAKALRILEGDPPGEPIPCVQIWLRNGDRHKVSTDSYEDADRILNQIYDSWTTAL